MISGKAGFTGFCGLGLVLVCTVEVQAKYLGSIWKQHWTTPQASAAVFDGTFGQVTPENSGKWGVAEPQKGQFDWAALDAMYKWADSTGAIVKQHAFLWGKQFPRWANNVRDTAIAQKHMREWMGAFAARYGSRTDLIDVVNEPINQSLSIKKFLGDSTVDLDWVIWTFKEARKLFPNSQLIINEYSVLGSATKTNASGVRVPVVDSFVYIVNKLKALNLIDGVGVQAHFLEGAKEGEIKPYLDKLATPGLPLHISEYEINIANDSTQLVRMKRSFPVFWEHPAVAGVTFWKWEQLQTPSDNEWTPDGYMVRKDGTPRPSLIWLRDYLKQNPVGLSREQANRSRPRPILRAEGGRLILERMGMDGLTPDRSLRRIDGTRVGLEGLPASGIALPVPQRQR